MTMVDRTTRWLEAVPLKGISASTCIDVFFATWVARFGVPETITTDRGTQFSSASWAAFCSGLGIRHAMTTSYHPQANGLVERSHRQLKDALRARGAGWTGRLTSLGSFSASGRPLRRSAVFLPLRQCLASL